MNFYAYSARYGMSYHETGVEAKRVAVAHAATLSRLLLSESDPRLRPTETEIKEVTWGEVIERAASTGDVGFTLKRQERLSYEAKFPQISDGRMLDGNDSLVLVKNIHDTDLLYNDLVLSIAVIWKSLSGKIQRFKQYNFEDVAAVLGLLFDKYKVERGGRDGNMQFFTFDRKFKLSIAIQKKIDFGPELQAAERKLNAALEEMTDTGSDNAADLKTIVTGAFTLVDGKLRVSEVLRLRSYKISNSTWNEAMHIIDAAIVVISSKKQIRLYERNEQGEYIAIPLDIAAL